jgi:hypothetical protein
VPIFIGTEKRPLEKTLFKISLLTCRLLLIRRNLQMARNIYPSHVTWMQFERIQPKLESVRRHMKPRTLDLYKVFCAVLYVLRSSWKFRMLLEGFPKWRSVHASFQIGSEERDGQPRLLETV